MQVLGGMLLHEKIQGHFPTFPKYVLSLKLSLYFLSLHFRLPSVWDCRKKKNPAPLLPKHSFPRTLICYFISPVSCVEYEALLILLEVELGKTGLENTWTGFWSIQSILPISVWSWKFKKHLFSTQAFSVRLLLQKIMVICLSDEKSKHFKFWPGGKCFTQAVCSRYSQTKNW